MDRCFFNTISGCLLCDVSGVGCRWSVSTYRLHTAGRDLLGTPLPRDVSFPFSLVPFAYVTFIESQVTNRTPSLRLVTYARHMYFGSHGDKRDRRSSPPLPLLIRNMPKGTCVCFLW